MGSDWIMAALDAGVVSFHELWPDHGIGRWMLAIGEESGEVLGAYCKWNYQYKSKPKTREDVLEEMHQLTASILTAASWLGIPPAEFLDDTGGFFSRKAEEIRKIRAEQGMEEGDEGRAA